MTIHAVMLGLVLALQVVPAHDAAVDGLVQELAQFPAELPAQGPSKGVLPPIEQRRLDVCDQLWSRGASIVPRLCQALGHANVQIRRNVALFLSLVGDTWYDRARPRLAIAPCASALAVALQDKDERVRGLAAHAIAATGEAGVVAMPALMAMTASVSEADRMAACIALRGLGPAASKALPALRRLESDPTEDVRRFARRAIERIAP
ncbi:MAG TPA: hypothetical protein VMF13_14015 [Luteitalea sp.]|nr:hypothetical protein [Luteitalea sp.]